MARNYIVLDTETADTVKHSDNKVHPETNLVYDIGWLVASGDTGAILCERSFVVAETFNNSALMNSAYYADKLPQYYAGIGFDDDAEWQMLPFLEIWQTLKRDIQEYNVKILWAYNARFDEQVLNHTIETYSNGFVRWFKPYKTEFRDIWDYASNITGTAKFVDWCLSRNYVSSAGNPSTGAEIVYRYLTLNDDFIERHTALNDACIENEILCAAKRKHKKTRHTKGQGWRDAAKIAKEM